MFKRSFDVAILCGTMDNSELTGEGRTMQLTSCLMEQWMQHLLNLQFRAHHKDSYQECVPNVAQRLTVCESIH